MSQLDQAQREMREIERMFSELRETAGTHYKIAEELSLRLSPAMSQDRGIVSSEKGEVGRELSSPMAKELDEIVSQLRRSANQILDCLRRLEF